VRPAAAAAPASAAGDYGWSPISPAWPPVEVQQQLDYGLFQQQRRQLLSQGEVTTPEDAECTPTNYTLIDYSMAFPPIKDQGLCASGWAFAAVAMAEASYYFSTGTVVSLSEQELLDCYKKPDQYGCLGGDFRWAISLIGANGVAAAASYPYAGGVVQACKSPRPPRQPYLEISKAVMRSARESELYALLEKGPVAIEVFVEDLWFDYTGGIFYPTAPCGGKANHAVVLVGAGVDAESARPYWIVRNSWGRDWVRGRFVGGLGFSGWRSGAVRGLSGVG